MSKSKFQSEKDKQESILNCIGSITGNLTEAVISGFNPSISNKRNSQQSPSFNQTASSPTFNQTASSPTFNQTASSPTFNPTAAAAPTINQNPSSVQDVWNRLLLPKKQQSPTSNPTASSPTFNQTASSPTFNQTASSPKFNSSVAPEAEETENKDTDTMDLSDQIKAHNTRVAALSRNPKSPNFVGPPAPGKKQRDTIGSNLYGNPVVNGKEMDSPLNNPRTVPFTPDFSGDAPPNLNLGSSGNKTQPTAPEVARLGYGASVRTPPAAATSKNSQTPMRGDEDQGTSETNQMITPNYSGEAQHQDMFAGTLQGRPETNKQNFLSTPDTTDDSVGPPSSLKDPEQDKDFVGPPSSLKDPEQDKDFVGPPSSSRRPGGAEDVAAGIVNKQDTIGTPDTTGTTIFTSKTGDFVAKPQNNNPQTNPGFMTSPQGAPASNSNQTEKQRSDDLKSVSKNPNTLFSDPSLSLRDQYAANRKSKNPDVVSRQKTVDDQNIQAQSDKQIGSDGRTIGAMRKENEQSAQAAKDRGQPLPIGGPEWVAWNRAKNQKRLDDAGINKTVDQVVRGDNASPSAEEERRSNYDPKEITRFNSQLARDRQQGILRPGERYKGTPGVGSLEDSRRGRVGLDAVGAQPDNSPEAIEKRGKEIALIMKNRPVATNTNASPKWIAGENNTYKKDDLGNDLLSPDGKPIIDKMGRKEKAAQREIDYQENNLLKLQRRTDLTNARNALEDAQNRKTSSGWNMSSASRGSGGGGAGQPPANTIKADADEMLKNMKDNRPEPITYPGVPHASSGKTMKSGTLIAELFDGDFLSNLKDAAAAVGTLATPPEELLYTTGGVMGRSGYTRQGASKRTKHYQNILNSIADLGVNGLANTVGQVAPKTTAGVINNTVYPATKVAANMLTRMLYDPRSDEDGDEVSLSFEDAKKKKKEEEEKEAAESETAPAKTRTKTKKSGTPVSPEGNPTGINPDTGNTWAKSDTNPVFGLANKIKPKTQQIQWNPFKANFSQQQSRAAAE